jgi:hypothetical protein
MSDTASELCTRDVLLDLGFAEDTGVLSNEGAGLSFDFGNLKLNASQGVSPPFMRPVIQFTGSLWTPRSGTFVDFQMPRRIASREVCAAWITYHLDSPQEPFRPERSADWLELGRQHQHLLPWNVEQAEYEASPMCQVEREWLNLALKKLARLVDAADSGTLVAFAFDKATLSIRCGDEVIPLPATGTAWDEAYRVDAINLDKLPKRLMQDPVRITVWRDRLTIGGRAYRLAGDGEPSGWAEGQRQ